MSAKNRQRLQLFQNLCREMRRNPEKHPPLIEIIELNDKVKRGESVELTLMDKKRLFVTQYALTTVYFIAAPDAGMVKIGKTTNLEKRFNTLQTMSPVPLQIACHIDYDDGLEKRIHDYLKDYRSHGEWFFAGKEVVDFMRGYRDNGIRWVVERVGEAPAWWANNRGSMSEDDRFELEWGSSRLGDPDYRPNTQNSSGIDFSE